MKTQDLFQNPILNQLSKTNSLLVIRVYSAISVLVFIYGLYLMNTPFYLTIAWVILGLLFFTLLEYIVHRYLYHSGQDYLDDANWQYKIHGVHHTHPREKHLLAMPLPLALFVSGLLFLIYFWVLGENVYFFFPGFLLGYALYLFIHYKVHTRKPPKNILRYLWIHHHIHHHIEDDKAFGVSSPLWDFIFGTMPTYQGGKME